MIQIFRLRKALLMVVILLITSCSQAVVAQSAGHSSINIDFGYLNINGDCETSSDLFHYDGSESPNRCILIEFDGQANSRFNISIQSERTNDELEVIELIVSPRTQSVVTTTVNFVIPFDMPYGEHRLRAVVQDWSPMSADLPVPKVNFDQHTLLIQRPQMAITGDFHTAAGVIEIPQSARITGVMSHSILGDISSIVMPVLYDSSSVISTSEHYVIRPGVTVERSVSFNLPESLEPGMHTLIVGLQDYRGENDLLWSDEIFVTISEPSGNIKLQYATWDINSFRGSSVLGTHAEDVLGIQLNFSNPGSLEESLDFWMNFVTEDDCIPVSLGIVNLYGGESKDSYFEITVPNVPDGTILNGKIMNSEDCNGDVLYQMESVSVFDRPASVKSRIHDSETPVKLDGVSQIPISFSVSNLEDWAASRLVAEVTLFAIGYPIGSWRGNFSLDPGVTETFEVDISQPYCYDGLVDASIEIRNSNGDLIDSIISQSVLKTYFVEGGFDLHSSLIGSQTTSLGNPVKILSQIQADSINPDNCKLLIPLMTIFEPNEVGIPPVTEVSLVELENGKTSISTLETTISQMSGSYTISQHLIRTFSNDSMDNWMESDSRFTEIEILPIEPDFNTYCEDEIFPATGNNHNLNINCEISNQSPIPSWVKIGVEIDDLIDWAPPILLESGDFRLFDTVSAFSVGSYDFARLYIMALWDGEWINLSNPEDIDLPTGNALDGFEPFPYEVATTTPAFPIGGEEFAINFWARGSTDWNEGTYEVKIWLDESKQGVGYQIPPQLNNLQIGELRLFEIGLNSWPNTCGKIPYEIIARSSEGEILDSIQSYFEGCKIEMVDFSVVDRIEISRSTTHCSATFIVENIGSRDYVPESPEDHADVTLIVDGVVEISSTNIPRLNIGQSTELEVPIPKSGFSDIRIIVNTDRRISELDRSNNGLGWASSSGPILFENDSDFDGLSNAVEEAGYEISTVSDLASLNELMRYIEDPANASKPNLVKRWVFPSPEHHDSDSDGMSDLLEWSIRSDPTNADTDGDGFGDFEEYQASDQDPLLIETNKPEIYVSGAIETRHPIDSETKSGLFTRIHTREFTVEDRNLALVTVTIVRPGQEPTIIPINNHGSDGDRNFFSVSYEYSVLDEVRSEVVVTAIDIFGNEATFALHETGWERATNKINSFATDSILTKLKIGAPVAGFLTGLIYGLKDIVDFAGGIINFVLNFWETLETVWGVIEDCTPRLQLPIRMPSDCPIDLSDIAESMMKSFVELSPYDSGSAAHFVFLTFTVWGFATIGLLTGSLISKAWGVAKSSSKAINSIAEGLSGARDSVIDTMGRAISSVKGGLNSAVPKTGIPGAIINKVSPSLVGIYSLGSKALGVVTGAILLSVFLVPKLLLDTFDDVLSLVWKRLAVSKSSNFAILDLRFYTIITKKKMVQDSYPDMAYDELLDEWSNRWTPGDKGGAWYEFDIQYTLGCAQLNYKAALGREVDCDEGGFFVEAKAGNQGENIPKTARTDNKAKQTGTRCDSPACGVNRWDGGDTEVLRRICADLTTEECAHALMRKGHPDFGKGLSQESLDRLENAIRPEGTSGHTDLNKALRTAKVLKEPNGMVPIKYSGAGYNPNLPCLDNPLCVKSADIVRKNHGPESAENFIQSMDNSGDFSSTSYPALITQSSFLIMSGEFGFVEEEEFSYRLLWLAPLMFVLVVLSYVYIRKLEPFNST